MPSDARRSKDPWHDPSLGSERETDALHGRRKDRDAKRAKDSGDEDEAE